MRRLLLVIALTVALAEARGRMQEPPARGSLWRFGYDAPVNLNDSDNDCGGTEVSSLRLHLYCKSIVQRKNAEWSVDRVTDREFLVRGDSKSV